ncbi:MAG TPA: homoserine O-acetyltransferase [Candidatus Paceibacterota bacterium]|nr:homoserine O-acetyltransferase [Candidatus Paceibacterota bacterium]
MSQNPFESSDTTRHAKPLRHARSAKLEEPLALELGGQLADVVVAYETYGELNAAHDNTVLVCHAISGDSHVARHDEQDDPGWWDIAVGPGKTIDTDRYFVICPNLLGGCRGTTGPGSINPATGKPYGRNFPTITVGDMVEVQRRLLVKLGIHQLLAVVGGSLGGHQALTWATRHSDRVRGVVALATSARLTSQALAFDVVGRNAILRDPHFHGGQYYDRPQGPKVGLALARMIGHITYLSREAMRDKFEADRLKPRDVAIEFEKRFSVGSYLGYQGAKFVERFDANSYLTLSVAMDLFDLGSTPNELAAALAHSRARWLVVSFSSDWLFPSDQSRDIVNALIANNAPVSYCDVQSSCGHDAFLLPNDLPVYGELTRAFLDHLAPTPSGRTAVADEGHGPTSIFHQHRLDHKRIAELIPPGASVLDLGCGSGTFLAGLRETNHRRVVGVELDEQKVLSGVRRGLDVIQADLNQGLGAFATGQFDCVVLSQTLQAVQDVERVLTEMVRIGRTCIVSIPNFGYHRLRTMLAETGRAPKSAGVLHYEWYNTPNIRFFTIADFEDFCRQKNFQVHRRIALDTEARAEVFEHPNLNADLAIFVISRADAAAERDVAERSAPG